MKINCYDNSSGEGNQVFTNLWSIWTASNGWLEEYGAYRCGAGEPRQKWVGAQAWWDGQRIALPSPLMDITDTSDHTYWINHDHVQNLPCSGASAERTWWVMFDATPYFCITWPGQAPHTDEIHQGVEVTNNDGTIRNSHHPYNDLEYRTAHSLGNWIDADLDVKIRNYPPIGAHWPSVGPDNQTHACIYYSSNTCH